MTVGNLAIKNSYSTLLVSPVIAACDMSVSQRHHSWLTAGTLCLSEMYNLVPRLPPNVLLLVVRELGGGRGAGLVWDSLTPHCLLI